MGKGHAKEETMGRLNKTHRWASASSSALKIDTALDAVIDRIRMGLDGAHPHVIFVFVSGDHRPNFPLVSTRLNTVFTGTLIFGASGGGVIGGEDELDVDSGVALIAAHMPNVDCAPIYCSGSRPDDLPYSEEDLQEVFGEDVGEAAAVILLPDPYSFNPTAILDAFNRYAPGVPVVGGLAGGGQNPGENSLFFGDQVLDSGMIGLVVSGDVVVDTLVAQGCRPLGSPSFVTSCKGNVLRELDGRPALKVLRELFQKLPSTEQERFRTGLLLGVGMEPGAESYEMGDFVMRNILGIDPETENIGVGTVLRPHQVVQFHVRDGRAASEDLREMLMTYQESAEGRIPEGALLFSCMGRGSGLFGFPNHDTVLFSELVGDVPIGGFFSNGEIGPVRGSTFLHGFTSAFAFFREISPLLSDEDER